MAYPGYPHQPVALPALPMPPTLPPGYGCLVVTLSRGPYLVPVTSSSRFRVDSQEVPLTGQGTSFVPVRAGPHKARVTDFLGVPVVTTDVLVHEGAFHPLNFQFGAWRNRVYDGGGVDVTGFGMWSNYTIAAIAIGSLLLVGLVCCGLLLALS